MYMGTVISRQFAVVTGASSGIGYELARECIEHDFDVLICGSDARRIHDAARDLGAASGTFIPIAEYLSTYAGVVKLANATDSTGRHIDALILNANLGVHGPFIETPLDEELCSIAINCTSIVHLAKRVVPQMAIRGAGHILITATVASTSPAPYLAVYGATRAFDLSFAEALRAELADTGVTVTALQPGATDTELFDRDPPVDLAQGRREYPAKVAHLGFEAMMEGKDTVFAASFRRWRA
jgi:short-subunit dehydrogenase